MKLLPPTDLLDRISGVEEGLKNNLRIKRLGNFGLVTASLQLVLGAASDLEIELFGSRVTWSPKLLVALGAFMLVLSLLLVARSRLWRRESTTPFRYTCSLVEFAALGKVAQQHFSELPVWLRYDLAQMLNTRIGRLSFVDEPPRGSSSGEPINAQGARGHAPAPSAVASEHIRISGDFIVRSTTDESWVIDVTPKVEVGAGDAAATLAHAVTYIHNEDDKGGDSTPDAVDEAGSRLQPSVAPTSSPHGQRTGPTLPENVYEKISERVYFSVATQIYRQIRSDVQHKIDLLPTRFLRANAYYHEAVDYARSNTLDGLDAARELFESAMERFDPLLRPLPKSRLRRAYRAVLQRKTQVVNRLRLQCAEFWPRLAKAEVLAASAEIGYANTLLYRRTLAGLSGHRVNSVYEARPVAQRAIARLAKVPLDVPGCRTARFDAQVAFALACYQLELDQEAKDSLERARGMLPGRYDQDAQYLYVAGVLEPRARFAIRLHRQAVERDPRLEVAQFELALRLEMMWRTRPTLERSVAAMVQHEYQQVLKVNPGNLRAWESIGYVHWLMKDLDAAEAAYERGREFKQMKPEAAISGLEYGLARVAAEKGDCESAYRLYLSSSSAQLLRGVSDIKWTSAQFYFFDFIGEAMMLRYDDYLKNAANNLKDCDMRIRDIVCSFVLNDHGEACHTYHIRNYDTSRLARAHRQYEQAKDRNPDAMLPHYNLYLLHRYEGDEDAAIRELQLLERLEPNWPDAGLAWVAANVDVANEATPRSTVEPICPGASDRAEQIKEKRDRLRSLLPHDWFWDAKNGSDFDWGSASRLDRQEERLQWERELNDLHVRALFLWILDHLLQGGDTEVRRSLLRKLWSSRGDLNNEAFHYLCCIREHFWPGNFDVLLATCRVEPESPAARRSIKATIDRWLTTDPTAYWALTVATERYHSLHGDELTLLDPRVRLAYLEAAMEALPPDRERAQELRVWVAQECQKVKEEVAAASGSTIS